MPLSYIQIPEDPFNSWVSVVAAVAMSALRLSTMLSERVPTAAVTRSFRRV